MNNYPIQYKRITQKIISEDNRVEFLGCNIVKIKDSWFRPARKIALCNGVPKEYISRHYL